MDKLHCTLGFFRYGRHHRCRHHTHLNASLKDIASKACSVSTMLLLISLSKTLSLYVDSVPEHEDGRFFFTVENCTDHRPTWFWNSTKDMNRDLDCPKAHWSSHYGFNSISVINGKCLRPNKSSCSSRISLTFQSSYKTVKTIQWEKTSFELLSEIGGHLGLFVGVSLMTVAEFGEFLSSLSFKACKRIMKIYPFPNERREQ